MKNITKKALVIAADWTLKVATIASGKASMAGTYQPKEPENFKKVAAKRNKKA
ncbi:MAG: cyclic lactone autoinducer peptide [Clostridia bacterium]